MEFKFVSKNNIGVVVTLILVVLLSQARLFDLLTETALGRMTILALIIFISYINKILGLLAVLAIIVAYNQYNMNVVQSYTYYEGFDGSGNVKSNIVNDKVTILKAKEDILKQKLQELNKKNNSSQATSASSNSTSTAGTTSTTGTTSENFGGREGFCMPDRELNILRGKQSNTISVLNNTRNQSDDISPSDKSLFSSSYSTF